MLLPTHRSTPEYPLEADKRGQPKAVAQRLSTRRVMSTKDHRPLPLGHKLPRILPSPTGLHLLLDPHALERVSNVFIWLEIGADFLSSEAFMMLAEQCQNQLAQTPTPSR